jgi:hypothetical protein
MPGNEIPLASPRFYYRILERIMICINYEYDE